MKNLEIPTKPTSPKDFDKYNKDYGWWKNSEIANDYYKLYENLNKIKEFKSSHIYSVDDLNKYKKDYQNEYIKNYENNFNKHYEKYRLQYYRDIINKYSHIDKITKISKIKNNENQYKITINICNYNYAVCCELKPTLSEDYPCVLRKLKTQIELTKHACRRGGRDALCACDREWAFEGEIVYILLIESFTSNETSKEQLITIFKQSHIKVIFTDEIFETSKSVAIKCVNTNTEQAFFENKWIEENKTLTYNLLQTQEKLLQAEEKIKQLEEEILSLKT